MTKLISYEDVKDEEDSYWLSLNKTFPDRKIKDVLFYPTSNNYDDELIIHILGIQFEDGTQWSLQGEHDIVYVDSGKVPSQEQQEYWYREMNGETSKGEVLAGDWKETFESDYEAEYGETLDD